VTEGEIECPPSQIEGGFAMSSRDPRKRGRSRLFPIPRLQVPLHDSPSPKYRRSPELYTLLVVNFAIGGLKTFLATAPISMIANELRPSGPVVRKTVAMSCGRGGHYCQLWS